MIKFFTAIFLLVLSSSAFAADATFSWIPNKETDLAGYKIHWGGQAGQYHKTVDLFNPESCVNSEDGRCIYTVYGIPTRPTYYALTAYDSAGQEGDYSSEVLVDLPPSAPADVKVTITYTFTADVVE